MTISQKNKQTLLVGCLVGGALLLILAYYMVFFAWDQMDSVRTETNKVLAENRANRAQLDEYRSYLQDEETRRRVEEQFERIAARLPSGQDSVDVFDILRGYFEGTDVQFTNLESGAQNKRGRFTEYPFRVRGNARYHEFGQLVNLIECDPKRLMRVNEMKLENNNNRPSVHPMELSISTFTFNP